MVVLAPLPVLTRWRKRSFGSPARTACSTANPGNTCPHGLCSQHFRGSSAPARICVRRAALVGTHIFLNMGGLCCGIA
eukprot:5783924-Alexandrium_andersonii.AAC.1